MRVFSHLIFISLGYSRRLCSLRPAPAACAFGARSARRRRLCFSAPPLVLFGTGWRAACAFGPRFERRLRFWAPVGAPQNKMKIRCENARPRGKTVRCENTSLMLGTMVVQQSLTPPALGLSGAKPGVIGEGVGNSFLWRGTIFSLIASL